MLDLLSQTEQSRVLTQRLVDALQAAELIQPWVLNFKPGEKTIAVEGLYRIDETALNTLTDDAYLSLRKRKTGALLNSPAARARMGDNARAFAQANYDLKTVCLPRQLQWVQGLVSK